MYHNKINFKNTKSITVKVVLGPGFCKPSDFSVQTNANSGQYIKVVEPSSVYNP